MTARHLTARHRTYIAAMCASLLKLSLVHAAAPDPIATLTRADIEGPRTPEQQAHIEWVVATLRRIEEVKPGMTRRQLLEVFTEEGGISSRLQRTYVSRECPLFKVDVKFEAAGSSARDSEGRVSMVESDQDVIVSISRPYLSRPIAG